jgi:hypothetical protein
MLESASKMLQLYFFVLVEVKSTTREWGVVDGEQMD